MHSCGLRLSAVALAAAALAACTQHSVVTDKSASLGVTHAVSDQPTTTASSLVHRRVAVAAKKRIRVVAKKRPAEPQDRSHGVASFYSQGTKTANGEKYDPNEMTAAHRTLPFGTRLRVTDVATGQSVTVRINDRGPFVRGRVVDLSSGAAESLGMVGRGLTKVKLDVVE